MRRRSAGQNCFVCVCRDGYESIAKRARPESCQMRSNAMLRLLVSYRTLALQASRDAL